MELTKLFLHGEKTVRCARKVLLLLILPSSSIRARVTSVELKCFFGRSGAGRLSLHGVIMTARAAEKIREVLSVISVRVIAHPVTLLRDTSKSKRRHHTDDWIRYIA